MRIHYDVVGEGHPLVLVHGWGSDHVRNWIETGWVATLAPIRRLVLMDCRGHGRSEGPRARGAYQYRSMSDDVVHVMDDLGIERADVFGYSMGAFMIASLLGHHRDRLSSAIMGGIGDETAESAAVCEVIAAALRCDDPATISEPLGRAYRTYVDADPNSDREALAVAALDMWPDGYPIDLGGPGLSEVDIPVLIVNGAEDHPYVDTADRLARAIPGAQLVTIEGTDHLSVVPHPEFKATVLDFLTRQ